MPNETSSRKTFAKRLSHLFFADWGDVAVEELGFTFGHVNGAVCDHERIEERMPCHGMVGSVRGASRVQALKAVRSSCSVAMAGGRVWSLCSRRCRRLTLSMDSVPDFRALCSWSLMGVVDC